MRLTKSLIYPNNIKRVILSLLLVIAITFVSVGAVYDAALKNVTLVQIDEFVNTKAQTKLHTRQSTISEFLKENEIVIEENEIFNKKLEDEISDNDVLIIRKGRLVELSIDGSVKKVLVTKPSIKEALDELGVKLSKHDVVNPPLFSEITENMSIIVDRYVIDTAIETTAIKFDTVNIYDKNLPKGTTEIVEKGAQGQKEVKYTSTTKNGELVSKTVVYEKVLTKPVTQIVKVGTKTIEDQTKKIAGYSYSKKLTVTATAYDTSPEENGGYSKTAMGLDLGYGVVAVDPRVIPLGTKLYIESPDGGKSWSYGYCIAGDVGGAIKGNRVDLCFETQRECIKFGRKSATVYILK